MQSEKMKRRKGKNEEKGPRKTSKLTKEQRLIERRAQQQKERREAPHKICTLCEKPHRMRTQLCVTCNKNWKEMRKQNERISIVRLLDIKHTFPGEICGRS